MDISASEAEISNKPTKSDIIIVGAGLSGLTSALKIIEKEPSLHVKILEATSKIGGQIASSELGEIGGKWMTPDQLHIYKIIKEFQTPVRPRAVSNSRLKRCWDIDEGILSYLVNHEVNRYIAELDLISQHFQQGQENPYKQSGSMRSHISKRLSCNPSKKMLCNIVLLICGADASDISFNDFMCLCCSNGGLKMLMDLYFEIPDTLFEIPSVKLLKEFEKKISKVEMLLKRKANEIRQFRDYIEVQDADGEVHTADVLILAVPWNDIENIEIFPAIPMELRKPPRPIDRPKYMMTSFLAKYVDGHWRSAGYSGNLFLNEPHFLIGHEYRSAIYSGLIIHEADIESIIRPVVLNSLSQKFGDDMLLPIEYVQQTYEMSPMTDLPFTTPWNRIVWSSSASAASCYRGRLGGAVQSGLRAAMNALFILRPQTVGWQDIAEIQCSSSLANSKANRLSIWLSSWNLLNFSYYGISMMAVSAALTFLYSKGYF